MGSLAASSSKSGQSRWSAHWMGRAGSCPVEFLALAAREPSTFESHTAHGAGTLSCLLLCSLVPHPWTHVGTYESRLSIRPLNCQDCCLGSLAAKQKCSCQLHAYARHGQRWLLSSCAAASTVGDSSSLQSGLNQGAETLACP